MPRSQTGAVLHDPAEAAAQALSIVQDKTVIAADGTRLSIDAQTLCMHGDTPGATAIAAAVRAALESAGVAIAPLDGTLRE
jgi:5-oxoprolinase (ATP-hydrolysing) subunit A